MGNGKTSLITELRKTSHHDRSHKVIVRHLNDNKYGDVQRIEIWRVPPAAGANRHQIRTAANEKKHLLTVVDTSLDDTVKCIEPIFPNILKVRRLVTLDEFEKSWR